MVLSFMGLVARRYATAWAWLISGALPTRGPGRQAWATGGPGRETAKLGPPRTGAVFALAVPGVIEIGGVDIAGVTGLAAEENGPIGLLSVDSRAEVTARGVGRGRRETG